MQDVKTGFKVDFIFSFSPYESQAIQNAIEVQLLNEGIKFASLEDLIIHKIIAGRARDIEDVKSILLKNPKYKAQYIMRWLTVFDKSLEGNFLSTFQKIVEDIS